MDLSAQQPYIPLCVMSTITYGTAYYGELDVFRRFRDNILRRNVLGEMTVKGYYSASPALSGIFSNRILANLALHAILRPLLYALKKLGF